jgi:release factor glutamine methyltransferase
VFAEEEAALLEETAAGDPAGLEVLVERRVGGEPLEHVLGWAELRGVRVRVDPGVFVPRQRTALLVAEASRLVAATGRGTAGGEGEVVVVDLCCGSGALGAVLATELRASAGPAGPRRVELHAADVDPAAVACASHNVAAVGGRAHQGDLFDAIPPALRGRVDVLLANVPYVPSDEIAHLPPEARDHEARVALDGGPDGLDVLRRVAADAPSWLAPGGHLLSEVSEGQLAAVVEVLRGARLDVRVVRDDEIGATGVVGTAPAATSRR